LSVHFLTKLGFSFSKGVGKGTQDHGNYMLHGTNINHAFYLSQMLVFQVEVKNILNIYSIKNRGEVDYNEKLTK